MMKALFDTHDAELATHFRLHDDEDRDAFAETLALLVRHTYFSTAWVKARLAEKAAE